MTKTCNETAWLTTPIHLLFCAAKMQTRKVCSVFVIFSNHLFLARFQSHVLNSSHFNQYQSAYRPGCSTEMALQLLLDRIYSTADVSKPTLLILPDLSAATALDTIVHTLLLKCIIIASVSLAVYTPGSSPIWPIALSLCVSVHIRFVSPHVLLVSPRLCSWTAAFLQRAQCSHCKRCISYSNSARLSVRPSVTRRYCVKTTACSTVQFAPLDSKMCLVL